MPITIAILGTCVSEDWYHYQSPHSRLDVKLTPSYQPSTLLSITSPPLNVDVEPGPLLKERERAALKIDFDKTFLVSLALIKPDVLIVELLGDSRKGSIAVGDTWISDSYILSRSPMADRFKLEKRVNPIQEPKIYFELFFRAVQILKDFLKRNLPNCTIILHQARWAEYYIDEDGVLQSYEPQRQRAFFRANMRLETLESMFASEVECQRIRIDDVPIFADSRHIWGPAADHYVRYYYTEFADRLRTLLGA